MPELKLTWLKEHPHRTIWASVNLIWLSEPMTLTRHTKSIRKWGAFALKITKWEFISSKTPTVIGLKFYLKFHNNKTESESITLGYLIV